MANTWFRLLILFVLAIHTQAPSDPITNSADLNQQKDMDAPPPGKIADPFSHLTNYDTQADLITENPEAKLVGATIVTSDSGLHKPISVRLWTTGALQETLKAECPKTVDECQDVFVFIDQTQNAAQEPIKRTLRADFIDQVAQETTQGLIGTKALDHVLANIPNIPADDMNDAKQKQMKRLESHVEAIETFKGWIQEGKTIVDGLLAEMKALK